MKRNLFIIIAFFIGIIAFLLLGNMILIGDKLGELTHTYVEIGFYVIILALFIIFIIRPIRRVHRAPELPKLKVDDINSKLELNKLARQLANNCKYITDQKTQATHQRHLKQAISINMADAATLREIIAKEIDIRINGDKDKEIKGINNRIKDWATTVFMVTAVSQNSKIDSLSVLYLNYKMIEDIILASGFRPTKSQLFKLYWRIISTALIAYVASDFTDDIDLSTSATEDAIDDVVNDGAAGGSFIERLKTLPIANTLAGSIVDGATNSLLTLRIGYVTRSYLTEGYNAFMGYKSRRLIRREAIKEALRSLPPIVVTGTKQVGGTVANRILKWLGYATE